MPVIAYLSDHKAETLNRVVAAASEFAEKHNDKDRQFLLAAGSAGIEAATNIVVEQANRTMLLYVYTALIILCIITFRSWRAVVVAILPLVVTSILCEALMVVLGIGVKVATLPVIALGVGIGVDYALYLLSVQLAQQRAELSLTDAYKKAVQFTGKVVALVGITLAAGVITWAWSPIKFQADMGILLAFMFVSILLICLGKGFFGFELLRGSVRIDVESGNAPNIATNLTIHTLRPDLSLQSRGRHFIYNNEGCMLAIISWLVDHRVVSKLKYDPRTINNQARYASLEFDR
jgi:hypothetical protein